MKVSIILAHPSKGSFNHAIAETAAKTLRDAGHEVCYHDLYAEGFDPILPAGEIPKVAKLDPLVETHCTEIASADGIIIVHPNWWGMPPAILKGWVDRVIRPGVAYEFIEGDSGEGVPAGLLKARFAIVFNTSNTEANREREAFGDPLETLWKNCIFGLCGVNNFRRRMFGVVVTSTLEERQKWLEEVEEMLKSIKDFDITEGEDLVRSIPMTEDDLLYQSWITRGSYFSRMLDCGDGYNQWVQNALEYLPRDVLNKHKERLAFIGMGQRDGCRLARALCENREIIILSEHIFPKAHTCDSQRDFRYFIYVVLHEVVHAIKQHRSPLYDTLTHEEVMAQEKEADSLALEWFNDHVQALANPHIAPLTCEEIDAAQARSQEAMQRLQDL